jgi:hypothetical protein
MTKPVRARVPCPAPNVAESMRNQEFVAKYKSCMETMTNSLYDGMRVRFSCVASANALKSVFLNGAQPLHYTLALLAR